MELQDQDNNKKTAIGFSYYNAEKEIPRALDLWSKYVDYIIAIDGRYWVPLHPFYMQKYKEKYSTDNSEFVLKKRYGDKLIHEKYFGTQMEKRQVYLDIAGDLKCETLIVWDSDDFIHPAYQDFNLFFKQLKAMYDNFADQLFFMKAWIPSEQDWPRQYNTLDSNIWHNYIRVHRNPGEQKHILNHYSFTNKSIELSTVNNWRWLHDKTTLEDNPFLFHGNTVLDGIRITTDRLLRTEEALTFGDNWAYANMHYENYEYAMKPYAHYLGGETPCEGSPYFFVPVKNKSTNGKIQDLYVPYSFYPKGREKEIEDIDRLLSV